VPVNVELRLIPGPLNRLLRSRDGVVGRDMQRRAAKAAIEARRLAPVGAVARGPRIRESIHAEVQFRNRVPAGVVTVKVRHALWVSRGTGIYVGNGYIVPKAGRYMIFSTAYGDYAIESRDGYYFAERVRGQRPNDYLTRALRTVV
jgi:hypothetical protein